MTTIVKEMKRFVGEKAPVIMNQFGLDQLGLRAYARSRSALYTSEGFLLPLVEFAATGRLPKLPISDLEFFKTARRSLNDLLESDIERIRRGVYPATVLKPESALQHVRRLPILFGEGWKLSRRRRDKKSRVFGDDARELLRGLPEYYQRNFHFQPDGYLSARSAELYEHQVEVLFAGAGDAMRRLIIQPLRDKFPSSDGEGLTFLEIGSGTGRATLFVRQAFPKAKIVSVDLSGPYLKQAQKQLSGYMRHDFVEADGAKLPFQDARFDAVYSVFLFHELPREIRSQVIRESARVLKAGGFFGLVDSLQLGDTQELDRALMDFPIHYHEPFYRDYIENPMAELVEREGLRIDSKGTGFFSKYVAAEKPAL